MLLHRIARALLVASGCGLASVALAGGDHASTESARPVHQGGKARLEAIRVELALLADRVTYNQAVEVVLAEDTVLLKGQVQDEATHKRVLEVARQNCYLPIADALSTIASTAARALPTVPLYKAARDALVRHLGSKADRFQIYTSEDGQVTLKGEVGSAEEKLAASRALRGVAGCTRISNCLEVRTLHQAGQAVTTVSSDGQSIVCTPTETARPSEPAPQPVQRVQATATEIQPALPRIQTPHSDTQAPTVIPSGLSPTRTVTVSTMHDGKEVSRPVTYVVPTSSGYATAPVISTPASVLASCPQCTTRAFQEGAALPEIESHPKERPILDKLFAWKNARARQCPTPELTAGAPMHTTTVIHTPASHLPQMTAPGTVMVQKPVAAPDTTVVHQVGPVTTTTVVEGSPATTQVVQQVPQQPTYTVVEAPRAETWPPAHHVGPVKAAPRSAVYQSRPLAGLAAKSGMKQSVEPVQAPAAAVVVQEQVQVQTVPPQVVEQRPPVVVPATAQPVAPKAVAAKPAPLTPTSAQVVAPPSAPQAAQVVAAPTPFAQPVVTQPRNDRYSDAPAPIKMSSKELIERVRASCGKMVRDVKIEPGADRKIVVHVYANPATEHLVVGKLLAMPELAASNVKLQLHLSN